MPGYLVLEVRQGERQPGRHVPLVEVARLGVELRHRLLHEVPAQADKLAERHLSGGRQPPGEDGGGVDVILLEDKHLGFVRSTSSRDVAASDWLT